MCYVLVCIKNLHIFSIKYNRLNSEHLINVCISNLITIAVKI